MCIKTHLASDMTDKLNINKIIETDVSIFTEAQKSEYRKNVAMATKVLQSKLAEASVHEFDVEGVYKYCSDFINFCFEQGSEPVMPESVKNKKISRKAKPIILKVLLESKHLARSRKTRVTDLAYSQLLKSSTVTELRQYIKLYLAAKQIEEENDDLKEMNKWLGEQISSFSFQDVVFDEDEKNRLYEVLEEDDEELAVAMKAHRMKVDMNMSEREIVKVLNVPRTTLQRIVKKFKLVDVNENQSGPGTGPKHTLCS